MTAETIAIALHGHRVGGGWMAPCPAHDDRDPSLSIHDGRDGRVLVRCHAGCEQTRVLEVLRELGLWPHRFQRPASFTRPRLPISRERAANDPTRTETALRLWRATKTASGTCAETYLRSRGIVIPTPSTLRFLPALRHPSGAAWPAMVALVTRGTDDKPVAIHRTFLSRDGSGKAPIDPQKMMLGPCRGGVVRLAPFDGLLMVGEGIETCLAAMQATGRSTWAALSTSGLRTLDLPIEAREVVVLADGDDPGRDAALDAALRWTREGRRVRVARPPRGLDFNDLLLGRTALVDRGVA